MCAICEQFGVNIHDTGENNGGGGGDPQFAPTESFTIAQAAAHLNRSGASWEQDASGPILGAPTTLTYGFRNSDASYRDAEEGAFGRFNPAQMATAVQALQAWADVSNITWVARSGEGPGQAYSNNATILFGNVQAGGGASFGAYAYLPENASRGAGSHEGDVWVNSAIGANTNPQMFEYGPMALLHELGHSLGFLHPGDYNAGQGNPSYDDADFIQDTVQYTVMSYWGEENTGADYNGFYPMAPQMIDIAAAQRLYGANMAFHTGDTTYGFNSTASRDWYEATAEQTPIFCAWDAGGEDTFDFSGYATKQTIDLRNGFFSSVGDMKFNVSIAAPVKIDGVAVNMIENAIGGSFKDTIVGNNADNDLEGRDGDDYIGGNKGADALTGGDGNDILGGGKGNDIIIGGLGVDVLTGNKNFDTFLFQSLEDSTVGFEDTITKGLDRRDVIDLGAIDADTTTGGDQAFHLGGAAFDGEAGELIRSYHAGSNTTFIQGDVDGDGDADFSLAVAGGDYTTFLNFVL